MSILSRPFFRTKKRRTVSWKAFYGPMRPLALAAQQRRRARRSPNEGQKVSYDVVADRRTGKPSAENLRAA
jgi:hypothetical protein